MTATSTEAIRAAITGGNYALAQELWNEYGAKLASDGLTESSLAEAATLVEWSRRVMLCARAHAIDRLHNLHVAAVYGSLTERKVPLVRISF
jgi:hypothetical protein